jgi:hypothetical protein
MDVVILSAAKDLVKEKPAAWPGSAASNLTWTAQLREQIDRVRDNSGGPVLAAATATVRQPTMGVVGILTPMTHKPRQRRPSISPRRESWVP